MAGISHLYALANFTRQIENTLKLALHQNGVDNKSVTVKLIQGVLELNDVKQMERKRPLIQVVTIFFGILSLMYIGWLTHTRPQILFVIGVVCMSLWYHDYRS
jgi:hypothetical protein